MLGKEYQQEAGRLNGTVEAIGVSEPFPIAARSLVNLAALYKQEDPLSPEQVVEKEMRELNEQQNFPWYRPGSARRRRLANEALGDTVEHSIRFRRTGIDFVKRFAELPDDAPVKIGHGLIDWWSIGHAKKEYTSRYYNVFPFRVMTDPAVVEVFVKIARKLGVEDEKVSQITEEVRYSNRKKPKKVTSLLTTASVVRHVLGDKGFIEEINQTIRPHIAGIKL